MKASENLLGSHISSTYFYLRLGMGFLAVAFPLLLWGLGHFALDMPLQNSMSAYYHTELRDIFVGMLVAIGFLLFLYKGFSRWEDYALNISGVLAVGIAVFPMNPEEIFKCKALCGQECMPYSDALDRTSQMLIELGLHGPCAVLFFVPIVAVCVFFSQETLKTIASKTTRMTFAGIYTVLGLAMLALPVALVLSRWLGFFGYDSCKDVFVFFLEWALIWSFGIFWIVKTIELQINQADENYKERRAPKKDMR